MFAIRPAPAATNDEIRPFCVNIPEADLVDLRRRLAATRWAKKETVDDGSQGVPLAMSSVRRRRPVPPDHADDHDDEEYQHDALYDGER
ncbi:epoxide hydrolase N-terminal domain-containing protein [Bradyrhizobium sp. UFLA05-153]